MSRAPSARPPISPPLRMLAVAPAVPGIERASEELDRIQAISASALNLRVLSGRDASAAAFVAELSNGQYDAVHYIGAGSGAYFAAEDRTAFGQVLSFSAGPTDTISPIEFDRIAAANEALRLVVLNGSTTDRIAGVVAPRVQATVGHRGLVTEDAALNFVEGFYSALFRGVPVDAAMTASRLLIERRDPGGREWSTPLLYLQSVDGTLIASTSEEARIAPASVKQAPIALLLDRSCG